MAKNNDKRTQIDNVIASLGKKFGKDAASVGSLQRPLNSIPTGILGLDYRLGTGGWSRGQMHVVYGPPDIGKSSAVGLPAIVEAQRMGLTCAIVAVEPHFSADWAARHGVDTENLLIVRPDNAEEAFSMLYDLVFSEVIDFVLFDSIGALVSKSEADEDGKMKQAGQAGIITWGIKRIAQRVFKDDVCVLFINQVRDNMKSPHGGLDMPGGHALEHMCATKVRLRGKDTYTKKIDGDDVVIGREIVAVIERNKMSEGTKQKAVFDFYQMETDEYPFGIDRTSDITNTAVMTGVIERSGSWFTLPGMSKPLNGMKQIAEHITKHPEVVDILRNKVLHAMVERNSKTVLKAVGDDD